MVVTPNRTQTLVFSANGTQFSDNQFTIINNASESAAAHVTLPGMTESIVVSPDSSTAYVAAPNFPVTGQSPGAIGVIDLKAGAVTAAISCPPVNPTNPVCVWPGTVPQGSTSLTSFSRWEIPAPEFWLQPGAIPSRIRWR